MPARLALTTLLLLIVEVASAQTPPNLLRAPYLQIATPTSMRIRWRTDVPAASRVRWRLPGSTTWSEVTSALATTEHEMPLAGLSPATVYEYQVGHGAGWFLIPYTLKTAPPAGSRDPVRIWVVGDSGTGDANARSVRDAYFEFAGSAHTDVMLMLGDNAYPLGTDAEYQTAVFQGMFESLMARTPVWPTLGNHDAFSAVSATQTGPYYDIFSMPTAGQAGGMASGTEAYYSFDHGNVHFVCLDSSQSDRSPTGPMATWLGADLASTNAEWIIAYWHHPPYSKGSHDSDIEFELVEMRTNLLPILEAGGVDLVLTGHSHSYERSVLLDGHHGVSPTFDPMVHARDTGDGAVGSDGAYAKPSPSGSPNEGAVHAVAGCSGQLTPAPLDHPVMIRGLVELGSLVIDVHDGQLDCRFLHETGVVLDSFTITKGGVLALERDHFVVIEGATWKYEDSGVDLGTAWRQPGFDDSTWSQGPGPLGYGEPWIATTVSFGNDPVNKHPTTYLRHSFTLDFDPAFATAVRALALWDDGFAMYLNGVEIARRNLPAGPLAYATPASLHEATGYELVNLEAALPHLVQGTNQLAVELHQARPQSSDLVFDARIEVEALVPPLHAGAAGVAPANDRLTVNGSTGGVPRTLRIAPGDPISIALASPGGAAVPFLLMGRIGAPATAQSLRLGSGIGTLCFFPDFLPGGDPATFTLAGNGFAGAGPLFSVGPTPWSLTLPAGLPTSLEISLQAVLETAPQVLRVSNAIHLVIAP